VQRLLHGERRVQGVPGRGERRKERVAGRLEHMATVRLDAATQDVVVSCQRGLHRLRRVLPQRVLPSMSVTRNVSVPEGNGGVEASARVLEGMVVRFGTER
jgi:hypothetical protein